VEGEPNRRTSDHGQEGGKNGKTNNKFTLGWVGGRGRFEGDELHKKVQSNLGLGRKLRRGRVN